MGAAGFAIPGHRIVVLDEQGQELPAGQPGILAVDREQSPLCWFAGYHGLPTKAFVGKERVDRAPRSDRGGGDR
ncbi:hypothetical protein WR25_17527 [Diploscapter pachys]|uniref:Uncharacterized protein n=1 Tax=Diploscapter pachys TaxID=2018661 RepID=A0A2A2KD09_9BILA|nr:hypothetical protein WR25_17527 [Diploscapter pachys]